MSTALELDRMTLEEKLRTMDALWENLCRNENDLPVPQWHKDLLDERERLVKDGQAKFLDWETAKSQIKAKTS